MLCVPLDVCHQAGYSQTAVMHMHLFDIWRQLAFPFVAFPTCCTDSRDADHLFFWLACLLAGLLACWLACLLACLHASLLAYSHMRP